MGIQVVSLGAPERDLERGKPLVRRKREKTRYLDGSGHKGLADYSKLGISRFQVVPLCSCSHDNNNNDEQSRTFSALNPLEKTAKLYEDFVDKSVKEYQANQAYVVLR